MEWMRIGDEFSRVWITIFEGNMDDDGQNSDVELAENSQATHAEVKLTEYSGEIGYMKNGIFHRKTNFSVEVVGHVVKTDEEEDSADSDDDQRRGIVVEYLIKVIKSDDQSSRRCFLNNADCMSTQTIISVLNKNFSNALWVPKDHQLDPDLPSYFQHVIKKYMDSSNKKEFHCVKVLGRQPNSEVWVINRKVQIDADGLIIPPNDRAYVFSPRLENKVLVDPPMIKTPLSTDGMQQLVKAMREFLGENFMSGIMLIGALVLSLHYEMLIDYFDCTPMAIAVGEPQSGKTTALNSVLSLIGSKIFANETTYTAALTYMSGTTLGFGLDDIRKTSDMEKIIVSVFNQTGGANYRGKRKPRCCPIMTSNWTPERTKIISRLVVLPFKVPREPHEGISLDEKEQALRAARKNASSSIGHLIKVGKSLISLEGRKKIFEDILPQICGLFGPDNKSTRIEKNYALCIHATVETLKVLPEDEQPSMESFLEHIAREIVPIYHECKPSRTTPVNSVKQQIQLTSVLKEISEFIKEKPLQEVLTFILPTVVDTTTNKSCMVVNIEGLCKFIRYGEQPIPSNEMRVAIMREKAGLIGKKAWFLMPDTIVQDGKAITLKRSGDEKNARNLQAAYIFHDFMGQEVLKEVRALDNRMKNKAQTQEPQKDPSVKEQQASDELPDDDITQVFELRPIEVEQSTVEKNTNTSSRKRRVKEKDALHDQLSVANRPKSSKRVSKAKNYKL
ncbi:uncharacterized protein [Montipora capricornis]|uniref:uncharacterized protein isoform X2 n=1 Tax=Montipora capricornis TaxID=246305 RepID=UPI0035F170D3